MKKKQLTKNIIAALAMSATTYVDLFNEERVKCEDHAQNDLTKDHNCFHGNTKTECNHELCPLKKGDR